MKPTTPPDPIWNTATAMYQYCNPRRQMKCVMTSSTDE